MSGTTDRGQREERLGQASLQVVSSMMANAEHENQVESKQVKSSQSATVPGRAVGTTAHPCTAAPAPRPVRASFQWMQLVRHSSLRVVRLHGV